MININILSLTKLEAFISKFIHCRSVWKCQRLHFCKRCLLWLRSNWIFSQVVWVSHWFLASCFNGQVNLKFLVVLYIAEWRKIQNQHTQPFFNYWLQNLQPKVEEITTQSCNLTMQFAVAPIATISWKKLQPRVACNWNLQSMLFYNY